MFDQRDACQSATAYTSWTRRCSVAPTDQNRNVMTQVGIQEFIENTFKHVVV